MLMHRHQELCARAVDPLEIAAGLEAEGFTDRTAARFRHRDVFSLAEELYARAPRGGEPAPPPAPTAPRRESWVLAALTPGAAAALTGIGLAVTHGPARLAVGATGALLLAGAVLFAVRRGPFRAPDGGTVPAAALWTLWLLAYAVGGDGLLTQVLSGGPDGPWDLTPGPLLGLALAVAPTAWCARLFADRARRRIADSRGLADFAAATRPLLLGTVALQLIALTGLLGLTGFSSGALALGALLLFARLLTVHGFPETATAALAAAGCGGGPRPGERPRRPRPRPRPRRARHPRARPRRRLRPRGRTHPRLRRRRARPAGPRDRRPRPGLGPHHPVNPRAPAEPTPRACPVTSLTTPQGDRRP